MAGLLSAWSRGGGGRDPMRESAALTTVYLLEQNQKFERFMQQKVDELETRVAAQQARLSSRVETAEWERWAALEAVEDLAGLPVQPASAAGATPGFETPFGSDLAEEVAALPAAAALEASPDVEEAAAPDYWTLLGGAASTEADPRLDPPAAAVAAPAEAADRPVTPETQREAAPDDIAPVSVGGGEAQMGPADRAVPRAEAEAFPAGPGDRSAVAEALEPTQDEAGDDGPLPSSPGNLTEAFAPPAAAETGEIWPEWAEDGLELLIELPVGADGVDVEPGGEPDESPGQGAAAGLEPETAGPGAAAQAARLRPEGDEADSEEAAWVVPLPAGEKDDWT